MPKVKHRFIVLPKKELRMLEKILEESKKMDFDVNKVKDGSYLETKQPEIEGFLRFCYPRLVAIFNAAEAEEDYPGGDELLALFIGNLSAGMSEEDLVHIRDQMMFISDLPTVERQEALVFIVQNCGRMGMACEFHRTNPEMVQIDLLINLKQHLKEAEDILLLIPKEVRTKEQKKEIEAISEMLKVLEPIDILDDGKNKQLNLKSIFDSCSWQFEENKSLFVTKPGLLGKLQKIFQAIAILFASGSKAFRAHLEEGERLKEDKSKVAAMFGP
jgi:hypothetical protein